MPANSTINRKRLRLTISVVIFVGALVVFRLFQLQIIERAAYAEQAQHQYVSSSSAFDRGSIYFTDREGATVAAAAIESGFKLAIDPVRVTDAEAAYEAINEVITIDRDSFFASAGKKDDPYEEIAVHISKEAADAIIAKELPGVTFYRDKWRFYPGGKLASKAIGFVSYKDDALVGSYGLESYYNNILTRSSEDLSVNFFAQLFADVQTTFAKRGSSGDVVTSIEPTVQQELEREVESIHQKWSSDATGAVVIDPTTGEIIAMAHVPTFDLNDFRTVDDISVYGNPFSQNVYEMGSIVKPLVMAGAIDSGAVTPETTYTDKGSVVVEDRTIYNFDKKGRGVASMQEVLNQSLNTGMVFVQQKMGTNTMRKYLLDVFKLGEKTGVDLPAEVGGLVGNLKGNNPVNFANAAFGQGIATTPLEIIRGYAALANGGHLITPHVGTTIVKFGGGVEALSYEKEETNLKPQTIDTMRSMLVKVVDVGYKRGLDHYTVAAKTGTAQIARPGGLGYYEDRNLHSLIGYFPASNPRFLVYFFNYYPKNNGLFAIQTLGDPFFNMLEFLGNYYEITPDR